MAHLGAKGSDLATMGEVPAELLPAPTFSNELMVEIVLEIGMAWSKTGGGIRGTISAETIPRWRTSAIGVMMKLMAKVVSEISGLIYEPKFLLLVDHHPPLGTAPHVLISHIPTLLMSTLIEVIDGKRKR